MAELDQDGRRLLQLLASLLPAADPERPDKMIGYHDAHARLGLENIRGDWGESLKAQGLENLAEWTKETGKPAITGIIVNKENKSPGQGYYSLFGRPNDDWEWWRSQVAAAKEYNWRPYFGDEKTSANVEIGGFRALLERVLTEYSGACEEQFKAHPLANIIRKQLPESLESWISDTARYAANGSPGQGVWATIPWVAAFDTLITDTVQNGYYVVYLFNGDMSGVHLSLNQGVASVKEQYGSGAIPALKSRAQDYLARLGGATDGLTLGPLNLSSNKGSYWGPLYEAGSVCSRFYSAKELPDGAQLEKDFRHFMVLYSELAARDERLFSGADSEDDEDGLGEEDLRTMREHKRIERNRSLAKKAKNVHGYTCQACGFDFEDHYGPIGKEFIEAHHKVPLAKLKGQIVSLDPNRDFSVLCSNCHRMIHKTEFVSDVREFRHRYVPSKDTDAN